MKTYNELLEQFNKLKKEIDAAREQEAQLIARRVLALLEDSGVDIQDLLQGRRPGRRVGSRVEPKYWNPDTGATWSGRGRMPSWLAGQDLKRFLIHQEDE
ncbi:H-NS histone family protein [Burkholderia sp. FERM BP-3421]|jgi:DNA-binding protein H-NS|uniref:H-NS histone family protein n=1 Tax=Burkholderia sp. FERM BP-3421 TaxID=1494466 RepID=UPI00235FD2F1|nr:H-NS histone family protein [Burkholderia sp. FERM BP-3421]WDD90993.1 H-NS histone family protein [Burkholderia sp. FERM BP-3421]